MPARDHYHLAVRKALIKDGWTITHDPLTIRYHKRDIYINLGAERLLGAEKGSQKIAVEVKSFVAASALAALEEAVGQYILYQDVLEETKAERSLYLAVPDYADEGILSEPIGELLVRKHGIRRMVYHPDREEVIAWKP
jgi:hypothetical protein